MEGGGRLAEWQYFAAVLAREFNALVPFGKGEEARRASVITQIRGVLAGLDDFSGSFAHVDVAGLHQECLIG